MSNVGTIYANVIGNVPNIFNVNNPPYNASDPDVDAATAIMQALSDANGAGGGVVYFPAGMYKLKNASLPIYSNVTWLGDGKGSTIITIIPYDGMSTASGIVVQPFTNDVEALENISFIGITFDAAGFSNTPFSIISIMSSGHSNINFYDCEFTGQQTESTTIYFGGQPQFGDGYASSHTPSSFEVPAVGSSTTLALTFDAGDRLSKLQLAIGQIVVGPQQYQGMITNIEPTPMDTVIFLHVDHYDGRPWCGDSW